MTQHKDHTLSPNATSDQENELSRSAINNAYGVSLDEFSRPVIADANFWQETDEAVKPSWHFRNEESGKLHRGHFIRTEKQLASHVDKLQEQPLIFIDTETTSSKLLKDELKRRSKSTTPAFIEKLEEKIRLHEEGQVSEDLSEILCLIQTGWAKMQDEDGSITVDTSDGEIFLTDALELQLRAYQAAAQKETPPKNPLEPLRAVFSNKDVAKVIHNNTFEQGQFDSFDLKVENVIDTLPLARKLRPDLHSYSLQALAHELCERFMSKKEQKAAWAHRPLRESQEDYAASDIQELAQVFVVLMKLQSELDNLPEKDRQGMMEDMVRWKIREHELVEQSGVAKECYFLTALSEKLDTALSSALSDDHQVQGEIAQAFHDREALLEALQENTLSPQEKKKKEKLAQELLQEGIARTRVFLLHRAFLLDEEPPEQQITADDFRQVAEDYTNNCVLKLKCPYGSAWVQRTPLYELRVEELKLRFPDIAEEVLETKVLQKDFVAALRDLGEKDKDAKAAWENFRLPTSRKAPSFKLELNEPEQPEGIALYAEKIIIPHLSLPELLKRKIETDILKLRYLREAGVDSELALCQVKREKYEEALKTSLCAELERSMRRKLSYSCEWGKAEATRGNMQYRVDTEALQDSYPDVFAAIARETTSRTRFEQALKTRGYDQRMIDELLEELFPVKSYKKPSFQNRPSYGFFYKGSQDGEGEAEHAQS